MLLVLKSQAKVWARSGQGQEKVRASSGQGQGKVRSGEVRYSVLGST